MVTFAPRTLLTHFPLRNCTSSIKNIAFPNKFASSSWFTPIPRLMDPMERSCCKLPSLHASNFSNPLTVENASLIIDPSPLKAQTRKFAIAEAKSVEEATTSEVEADVITIPFSTTKEVQTPHTTSTSLLVTTIPTIQPFDSSLGSSSLLLTQVRDKINGGSLHE
ncbi:hypothetical protein ACFE04_021634 [Oxalis oulophora]